MGKFWQNKSLSLLIHELTFLNALLHHLTQTSLQARSSSLSPSIT